MIRSLLLGAALCALPAAAQDKPTPQSIEGAEPWGKVTRVMEPDYPPEALARKLNVHVDITGRLNGFGVMEHPAFETGNDDAKLLIEPLRDVIRYWRFVPAMDANCQPTDSRIRSRVWFDLSGEKPGMSVARLKSPDESTEPGMKVERRVDPRYPHEMLRRGWQANVFAKVTVAPSGEVVSVVATAYPKVEGFDLEPFETSVVQAMSRWRFAAEPGRRDNREGCHSVVFRVRD